MKVFVVDISRCNGCYNCQIACKDEHCGNDWSPYAKPQPDIGQFWCKLNEKVHCTGDLARMTYTPVMCQHCEDAPCMAAAPGAVYRREDGLVVIDPEKAKGIKAIAEACPYGAVFYNEELDLCQKCTGCAHLLDNGWQVPRCVDACPTDAIRFGDAEDFAEELANSEYLEPLTGSAGSLKPIVHYLNLPKRYVGGTFVDFEADEVVIGAKARLLNAEGDVVAECDTDDFGDFIFKQVRPGRYTVVVGGGGYADVAREVDLTHDDLNLEYVGARR